MDCVLFPNTSFGQVAEVGFGGSEELKKQSLCGNPKPCSRSGLLPYRATIVPFVLPNVPVLSFLLADCCSAVSLAQFARRAPVLPEYLTDLITEAWTAGLSPGAAACCPKAGAQRLASASVPGPWRAFGRQLLEAETRWLEASGPGVQAAEHLRAPRRGVPPGPACRRGAGRASRRPRRLLLRPPRPGAP